MEVATFAEIEERFLKRVHTMVWCNMATLDTQNRPRSRAVHPIWEGSVGWIASNLNTLKAKHIQHQPYLSLAYIADPFNPVYVECRAEWDHSPATKERIWDLFLKTPPPLGYDPTPFFIRADHPNYTVLKLMPWRIQIQTGAESIIWRDRTA